MPGLASSPLVRAMPSASPRGITTVHERKPGLASSPQTTVIATVAATGASCAPGGHCRAIAVVAAAAGG
eukprot:11625383-Alexandrium_andersonii.AAC.1